MSNASSRVLRDLSLKSVKVRELLSSIRHCVLLDILGTRTKDHMSLYYSINFYQKSLHVNMPQFWIPQYYKEIIQKEIKASALVITGKFDRDLWHADFLINSLLKQIYPISSKHPIWLSCGRKQARMHIVCKPIWRIPRKTLLSMLFLLLNMLNGHSLCGKEGRTRLLL